MLFFYLQLFTLWPSRLRHALICDRDLYLYLFYFYQLDNNYILVIPVTNHLATIESNCNAFNNSRDWKVFNRSKIKAIFKVHLQSDRNSYHNHQKWSALQATITYISTKSNSNSNVTKESIIRIASCKHVNEIVRKLLKEDSLFGSRVVLLINK